MCLEKYKGCWQVIDSAHSFTFEDTCDPAGLHLSLGHDGSKSVDETNDSQSGMLQVWRKNVLVEPHTVPRLVYSTAW